MQNRLPRHLDLALVGALSLISLIWDLAGSTTISNAIWRALWVGLVALAGREADRRSFVLLAVFGLALGAGFGLLAAVLCGAGAITLALPKGRPDAAWRHPLGAATAGLGALALCHQSTLLDPVAQAAASLIAASVVLFTSYRHLRSSHRKRIRQILYTGVAIFAVALAIGGLATLRARAALTTATNNTQQALELARTGDLDESLVAFERASQSFGRGEGELGGVWTLPARVVPVVGDNLSAGAEAADVGHDLTEAAVELGDDGDYQSLKMVDGSLDLEAIKRMTPGVQKARVQIDEASERLAKIDRTWLLGPTMVQLEKLDGKMADARRDVVNAAELLQVVPVLFGADGPTNWYVMFAQPAEARFQGGMSAEYAVLQADHGRVENLMSGGTPDLNAVSGERTLDMPEWYVDRYSRYHPEQFFQNHTVSPDFPTNAQVAGQIVPQVGLPEIKGSIYVDPTGLAALLELTGPVLVEGVPEPLTADNAERYLYIDQYSEQVNNKQRNQLLHEAGDAAFDKLLSGESAGPGKVARVLGPAVAGGHIAVSSLDPTANAVLDRLGISGRFAPPATGDWVSVRYADSAGSKLDVYLERDLKYEARVDGDGTLHATATLTLRNTAPDNLPEYVMHRFEDVSDTTIPLQLSLYSPQVVKSVSVDGERRNAGALREPWANTFTLPVLVSRDAPVVVVFELEGVLPGNRRSVTVIPQPAYTPMTTQVELTGPFEAVVGESSAVEQPVTFGS